MTTLLTYKDTADKQTGKELLIMLAKSPSWKNTFRDILETKPCPRHRYQFTKLNEFGFNAGACAVLVTYMKHQTLYKFLYSPSFDYTPEIGYYEALSEDME